MPFLAEGSLEHETTYEDGLAEIRLFPKAAYSDGLTALTEILDASWRPDMRSLLIVDEGSEFSPTREEIGELKKRMDTILSGDGVKIAIVVAKIVHFGIGRVLEARVDAVGRVRVFMNEQAAREWLGGCDASAWTPPPSGGE